jgi:hypothetical protein
MDENELKSITFKVSSEEAENIDNAARQAGLSRSEYLRQRLLVSQEGAQPAGNTADTRDPTILLYQILYGIDRLHNGMYMMAEEAKTLSPQQLKEIFDETTRAGVDYLSTIDERIAKTRRQLAERLAAAPPPAAGK